MWPYAWWPFNNFVVQLIDIVSTIFCYSNCYQIIANIIIWNRRNLSLSFALICANICNVFLGNFPIIKHTGADFEASSLLRFLQLCWDLLKRKLTLSETLKVERLSLLLTEGEKPDGDTTSAAILSNAMCSDPSNFFLFSSRCPSHDDFLRLLNKSNNHKDGKAAFVVST